MAEGALRADPATAAFDAVAEAYDEVFSRSQIGVAQRAAVHRELDRVFRRGQRILEINCGTGVDAVYLARREVSVLACDASARMIEVARRRTAGTKLQVPPEFRVLPSERIGTLVEEKGNDAFDGMLSNFAGLNCVEDIAAVARNLAMLLKPGAPALICVFGRVCAWEIAWYLGQGRPKKAFRRLRLRGDLAQLAEGAAVHVSYPSVRRLAGLFSPHFQLKEWKGIGIAVPPTYLESLVRRFPAVMPALRCADQWLGACPLARGLADHRLIRLERTEAQ